MATIRNSTPLSTKYGACQLYSFYELSDSKEHIALVFPWKHQSVPLVRIHSCCVTGEVFSSNYCDCKEQLEEALKRISKDGGIVLYLQQEGRGAGLYNKLDAYALQRQGYDTFEANHLLNFPDDLRSYKVAAEMLHALNVTHIALLSNNPDKYRDLENNQIVVKSVYSTGFYLKKENAAYLHAKIEKAGHCFERK